MLEDNERLILFHQRPTVLTTESLKGFYDAGIRTVEHEARWFSWHEIEPEPGKFNWDVPDRLIDRTREAGLKSSLGLYWRAPDWLPGCFDQQRSPATWWLPPDRTFNATWRAVNPYNKETMKRELEFLERACERYDAPDILPRYTMYYGGERILPFGIDNTYSAQFCIDTVLYRQRIFAKYTNELWTSFHPMLGMAATSVDRSTIPYVGNEYIKEVYDAMVEEFPEHQLNSFFTEFFNYGGYAYIVDFIPDTVKKWVGAQFVAGVVGNSKKIKGHGIWGLIMAYKFIDADAENQPGLEDFKKVSEAIGVLCSHSL